MKKMNLDLGRFRDLAIERIAEVAKYQKLMCGKVQNMGKETQLNVSATDVNSALTYIDMFTQDYLMVPLFKKFPFLVPLVEEKTGMKVENWDNDSEYALVMDPLDGTLAYSGGKSNYSIMLGLLHRGRGEMILGIGCYPHTGEIYLAIRGQGVWKKYSEDTKKEEKLLKIKDQSNCDKKNVTCHYRFLKSPFDVLSDKLVNKGYLFSSPSGELGTNLTSVLRVAREESCAFIGPHMAFHDFAVPSLIIEEMGGIIHRFDYQGKDDVDNWISTDNKFWNLSPKGDNPRFRIIIANNKPTADRIINDMK